MKVERLYDEVNRGEDQAGVGLYTFVTQYFTLQYLITYKVGQLGLVFFFTNVGF